MDLYSKRREYVTALYVLTQPSMESTYEAIRDDDLNKFLSDIKESNKICDKVVTILFQSLQKILRMNKSTEEINKIAKAILVVLRCIDDNDTSWSEIIMPESITGLQELCGAFDTLYNITKGFGNSSYTKLRTYVDAMIPTDKHVRMVLAYLTMK